MNGVSLKFFTVSVGAGRPEEEQNKEQLMKTSGYFHQLKNIKEKQIRCKNTKKFTLTQMKFILDKYDYPKIAPYTPL